MAQADQDEHTSNGTSKPTVNGDSGSVKGHRTLGSESEDPQTILIGSLRSQIQDLFSQVTQLNGKLVKSYDRVSDLEDDLHVASANLRQSTLKVSQLELERTQHLSALNTGLLVEKSQVTSELTRLMEKATEEAAQRGQAESARADIEKDLDDLSANLFDQANNMVAEARYAKFLSEEKLKSAEEALKGAEEAVTMMQQQMQVLQGEKEESDKSMQEMRVTMGKGKWVEQQDGGKITRTIRLLSSHTPYQEFLLFIAHLRSLHSASPQSPAMATLLPLPFLARLMVEDSDPTIRLDLAPALNWLSRRSVLSAIHNGNLTIEPMAAATLLHESSVSPASLPGLNNNNSVVSCALCGVPIFPNSDTHLSPHTRPPVHPSTLLTNGNSWSTSLFKRQRTTSTASQPPSPPPRSKSRPTPAPSGPQQIYIFRITGSGTNTYPSLPNITTSAFTPTSLVSNAASSSSPSHTPSHPTHHSTNSTSQSSIYPLCAGGWCLTRLRATCSLWAFVRNGIVEKVWEEEVPNIPLLTNNVSANASEKPPVPPRRRGLWGMATALQERAASWSENDRDKGKKSSISDTPKSQPATPEKKLPAAPVPRPPPAHPIVAATVPSDSEEPAQVPTTPPPLPKRHSIDASPSLLKRNSIDAPPPLPKRNRPTPTTPTAKPLNGDTMFPSPVEATIPTTPTHIPLPESRPGTPSTPVVMPSRTASPAPQAGGVPPPVPRRAAARGPRPMSTPRAKTPVDPSEGENAPGLASSTEDSKDGSSPVTGIPEAISEENSEAVAPEAPDTAVATEKTEEVKKEGNADESAPGEADAAKPEDTVTEAKAEEGVSKGESEAVKTGTETKDEAAPTSDVPEADEKAEVEVETSAVPEKEKETAEQTAEAVPQVDGDVKPELVETNGTTEERGKEDDGEVYIGISTWEERTWKEVIRLKEVMFWARVGGIKSDE
ncbi:hypothetical protein D9758_003007 [Tetrapyrgos nigripes]|uniref:GDP/GTP exchange factor Sec2 N-terminal domain-containing protein n=1 Tax=Tetrapyrgos nigripes TaxID=182062 RepID=A0A8H5GQ07_9AGAR|nr:hypothetical protein D9758_003007 [Tetrapyrgos nigripes]